MSEAFQKNFKSFISSPESNTEFEVRFGHYSKHFNSYLISPSLYHNVKRHLDEIGRKSGKKIHKTKHHRRIELDSFRNRKVIDLDNGQVQFQNKRVEDVYDNFDWGIRIARSIEQNLDPIPNFQPDFSRKYIRRSYFDLNPESYFYGFRIDLTEVTETKGRVCYEVELEVVDPFQIPSYQKWWGAIKTIYGWMLNAETPDQIISIRERCEIGYLINSVLVDYNSCVLSPRLVNRPVSLMNLEGIQDKMVSPKLDGFHRLMVFCPMGVYSCAFGMDIQKYRSQKYEDITIIECEYLPQFKKYYAFDILFHQDVSVTDLKFEERYHLLKNFILETDLHLKKFYPLCELDKLLQSYEWLQLPQDGLIFTSTGSYRSQPVLKWKPPENLTADFLLVKGSRKNEWRPLVQTYQQCVPFVGYDHQEAVVRSSDDTNYQNLVVECKYHPVNKVWEPIKVRSDKSQPNARKTVESIEYCLRFPISLEQIRKASQNL